LGSCLSFDFDRALCFFGNDLPRFMVGEKSVVRSSNAMGAELEESFIAYNKKESCRALSSHHPRASVWRTVYPEHEGEG